MEEVINNMDILYQNIMKLESERTEKDLIRMAICNENGIVINTIVVDENWVGDGIPIGDFLVGIGCKYDFINHIFIDENNIPVLTFTETESAAKARLNAIS